MSEDNFKSVSLNKGLHKTIETFVGENPEYRSIPDFLSEAARVRMEEVTRLKLEVLRLKLHNGGTRIDK